MKKTTNKNLEMQIYEKLGIKVFRKIAFARRNFVTSLVIFPFTLGMSIKERYDCVNKIYYGQKSIYNLGKIDDLNDIKKYKKYPTINSIRFLIELGLTIPVIIKIIDGRSPIITTISTASAILVNFYCIMLQRYNAIRLNRVIQKVEIHNEKMKKEQEEIKDKIKDKIKEKKEPIKVAGLKEVVANSTIEQLKRYREYINEYQSVQKEPEYLEYRVNEPPEIDPPVTRSRVINRGNR